MNTTSQSPEMALLRRCVEEMSAGDLAGLERLLAEHARWLTVVEGPTNCEGRSTIVRMIRKGLGGRLRGSIAEMSQHGSRVLVGFRPERPDEMEDRPLDDGLAYMVVTVEEGEITELKGCADRAGALRYAQTGELPEPPASH
jgi:hypothetical protein